LDEDLRRLIVTLAIETRNGYAQGELSYALSTRDVAMFAQVYNTYLNVMSPPEALKMALRTTVVNRYEDNTERATVRDRIFSIFGVEV
ncbi:MAG: CbbQ/NirQ/NorQ C-terminal domain-containing protein, partial [Thermoplasmata archaeon]|nr:CbbQ/NirQ/NorQ C-terminal domain-containing protein [Thermoplasmata archaeon]